MENLLFTTPQFNFKKIFNMNAKFNLRVGIDGRALRGFIQGSRTGVARYCWEICQELSRELPKAQFFVYSPVEIELPVKMRIGFAELKKQNVCKASCRFMD